MLRWIVGLVVAGLAWLAWELVGEIAGEAFVIAAAPITRPIWRAFVAASWPWPLLLLVGVGGGAAWLGWLQANPELATWRRVSGLTAFLGGCIILLLAPFIWAAAQRDREEGG